MAEQVPRPYALETDNKTAEFMRRMFWDAIDDQLPMGQNGHISEGNDIFDPFKKIITGVKASLRKEDPSEPENRTLTAAIKFYHDFMLKMAFVLQSKPHEVESTHAQPLDHHSHTQTSNDPAAVLGSSSHANNSESA